VTAPPRRAQMHPEKLHRVALARALIRRPRVLVLEEPSAAFAPAMLEYLESCISSAVRPHPHT
jgi:ABC-type sulfate/molybdate transport systems ATPase subunit